MHTYSVITAGKPLQEAEKALVLVHGRGSSARNMLALADSLHVDGFALLAPQATNSTWYPLPFLAPRPQNQPWLDSALDTLARLADEVAAAGIKPENTYWLGFSQGACLALDFVASYGVRFGGAFGLSGGLIGSSVEPDRYTRSLEGLPVFLGCSDVDSHIPLKRVYDTESVFKRLDADVRTTIYPGMGHTINDDEIRIVNEILDR